MFYDVTVWKLKQINKIGSAFYLPVYWFWSFPPDAIMPYARVPQILFWSTPLYFMSAQVHSFHEDPKCWLNHDQYFLCTSASKSPSLSIYLNIMRKIFPLLQAVNHDCFLYERPKISCYIYTRYTQQMCLMPLCSNVLNSREYTVSIEQM